MACMCIGYLSLRMHMYCGVCCAGAAVTMLEGHPQWPCILQIDLFDACCCIVPTCDATRLATVLGMHVICCQPAPLTDRLVVQMLGIDACDSAWASPSARTVPDGVLPPVVFDLTQLRH